jgi:hypothetical protein
MEKQLVVLTTMLLTLVFGRVFHFAQNSQAAPSDSGHAKHSLAVSLLRAINTAEMSYRHNHGEYGPWAVLFDSPEFPYGARKLIGLTDVRV